MKYWFFDGNDVVGPFEAKELAARPGFAATSLVCPENYSEDEDSWKMAAAFAEFHFDPKEILAMRPPEAETGSFDEEMNTLLRQHSPLGEMEDSLIAESASLEIPKKPAKPGPIEDYFNNIQGEDLGNILGIPDPNENSDMNLARAFQTQFGKTTPPSDKEVRPLEKDPFDEFAAEEDSAEAEEPDPAPRTARAGNASFVKASDNNTTKSVHETLPPAKETAAAPQPLPISIPISQISEEEIVLTVHGQETPASEPKTSQKAEPPHLVQSPDFTAQEDLPRAQLPVLDQPETQIPPLPEDATLPLTQNASSSTAAAQDPILEAAQPEKSSSAATEERDSAETVSQSDLQPQETAALSQTAPQFPTQEELQPQELVPAKNTAESEPTHLKLPETDTEPEDPKEATVRHILEGKLEVTPAAEIAEPIKNVPVEPQVNHVRTRLKQTPEIEAFLTKTQNERMEREKSHKKAMAALSVLVALLAVGAAAYMNQTVMKQPAASIQAPESQTRTEPNVLPTTEKDTLELLPDIPVPPPPEKIEEPTLGEKALEIVQKYQLPGNKGSVVSYLERLYRPQLSQGYIGNWSVEPLHKSTYIVKYRLTKTRMEPIVYIFQADAATGKLTGALNNITLDLVGKIQ